MLIGPVPTVAEVARLRLALTQATERLAASEAPQHVLRSLRREVAVLLDKIGPATTAGEGLVSTTWFDSPALCAAGRHIVDELIKVSMAISRGVDRSGGIKAGIKARRPSI
jgi:hypothetical protein